MFAMRPLTQGAAIGNRRRSYHDSGSLHSEACEVCSVNKVMT